LTVQPVWCRIEERRKVMYADQEYKYDYDSDDIEDLFEDYDEYNYDYSDVEYDNYYHNITDELVDD
jgi:hypothetical protein